MSIIFDVDETCCPIMNEKVNYYEDCRYCKYNKNYGTVHEGIICKYEEETNE